MANDWKKVKNEVDAFKTHAKKFSEAAAAKTVHSVLFTKEEIEKLLNQKGDGSQLDGIRIYLGGENVDGHMVPSIHAIAAEKDEHGNFHDFSIEENMPDGDGEKLAAIMPMATSGVPCPPQCSKKNFLNS